MHITVPPGRVAVQQFPTRTRLRTAVHKLNPTAYTFVIPFLIIFFVFRLYPFLLGILTSFTNAKIGPRPPKYIGFDNYAKAFTDPEVQHAFTVSIKYSLIVVPMSFFCSLFMALYVNERFPTHTFSRLIFYAPFVLAATVVAMIWNWMLQTQIGLVNVGLGMLGLPDHIAWLTEPSLILLVIAFITTWWQAGFGMVIFLGALQDIPNELFEAARIDGATFWQTFWRVTFPLLLPASTLVITISLIEAMRVFSLVHIITQGGPSDYSTSVVYYIFRVGFSRYEQGMAAAIGVLLFIVIAIFTAARAVLLRGEQRYY